MSKKITFEEFSKIYDIRRHPLNWVSPYENTMLDYTNEEIDYVSELPEETVWSLVEGKKNFILSSGLSYKNVIGFFIGRKPWLEKIEYILK